MASRRKLKKNVNNAVNSLFTIHIVCITTMTADEIKVNGKKVIEILDMISYLKNELISRISHTQPGNAKGFYKKFHNDFEAKTQEIIKAFGTLSNED